MKPQLCAEIRLPLKDSPTSIFSSGYAIGADLLLTCRHGLHHGRMAADGELRITWRDTKGNPLQPILVKREAICWLNQELDVALIRCPCPHLSSKTIPQHIINASKPMPGQSWQAGGFLAHFEDIEKKKEWINPQGTISKTFPDRDTLELWIEKGNVADADLWHGFSGSAVFAGQKITGVVLVANEGKQGQHLTARSMAGFLTAQDDEGRGTFAEAIGWHKQVLREQRQQRQFERMCMAIENEADVLDAMIGALVPKRQGEAALPAEPEAVTRAFNELEDDLAVKCIVTAFSTLCQKGKKRQAECISRFAEAWLPVLFEHDDQLDGFRAKLEDPACSYIEAPTSLPLPTELMMAEAEGKLARLELSARKVLISRQDLGFFAEPGLDEEGKERQRQVDEILSRRFLTAAEQNKFAPAIDAVVEAIGKDKDNLGELAGLMDRTKKQQRLAEILEELFDAYQRHFYYRFKTDEGFDLQGLEEIKRRYPTLVFLLTRCRDEAGEGKRYSRLSRIIAAAKGDHTFCEEIAKYA